MHKLPWLMGNALAGYLDFCVGLLIATLVGNAMGYGAPPILLLWGAVCALLPDTDIVLPILRGRIEGDHRTTLWHRPAATFLGLTVFLLALNLQAGVWAAVGYAALLWHYLHDTPMGGIAWLWPYSDKRFIEPAYTPGTSHEYDMYKEWCLPSYRSVGEVLLGTIVLVYVSQQVSGAMFWVVAFIGTATFVSAFMLWGIMSQRKAEASR